MSTTGNTEVEEEQAGIKIAGRNINNLRYAEDTTLMTESEELKSLLMKVKEESEKVGYKLNIHKARMPSTPSAFNLSQHQNFTNESTICIRCPKYWSFSFSISTFNEYSGLISLRIDWFNLLAIQRTLKSTSAPHFKSISSSALNHFYCPTVIPQSQGCPTVQRSEDSSPGQGITALAEGRQTH